MITRKIHIISLAFFFLFQSQDIHAQSINSNEKNRILFIFDASQSMLSRWQSGRKIDIAKELLSEMVDSLKYIDNLELGLRIYGHRSPYPPKDCDDTYLEVDFSKSEFAAEMIKKELAVVRSRGTTPLAKSLEEGAKDFPDNNARNIVILITDGLEECGMDPCIISSYYQNKGIILKPFIIGVGIEKEQRKQFDCVGKYFDASNEDDFSKILNIVISHVLDNTSAQVNLLDDYNNPSETNIPISFYDNFTGKNKYNFVHTLNSSGLPDTLFIDPIFTYDVVAHTIPKVKVKDVEIFPGKHTTIPINVPQGSLRININSKENYPILVSPAGIDTILNIQYTNESQKYLKGFYDITILTLPKYKIKNIEIVSKNIKETIYTIDPTGYANIRFNSKGYGGLYHIDGDKMNLIHKFNGIEKDVRLNLLSGRYKVIFRPSNSKSSIYSIDKNFTLKSGESKLIKIY